MQGAYRNTYFAGSDIITAMVYVYEHRMFHLIKTFTQTHANDGGTLDLQYAS